MQNRPQTPDLDIDELKKYLGWLFDYRSDIEYWNGIGACGYL
jgi:hypothetical protein